MSEHVVSDIPHEHTVGYSVEVDEISHLSDQDQAEAIADSFSAISNEYQPIQKDDICIPSFSQSSIPQLSLMKLKNI